MLSRRVLSNNRVLLQALLAPPLSTSSSSAMHPVNGVKRFNEIPGPKGYPIIGTGLEYTKPENRFRIGKIFKERFDQYGHIYRERMFPGMPEQVVINHPQDVEAVFRADGQWPIRPLANSPLVAARKAAKLPEGLFFSHGEQWYKQRMPMSKFTLVPRKIAEYHGDFNAISKDLKKVIRQMRDPDTNMLNNIPTVFYKWSFESVAMFLLGKRLGCLDGAATPPECLEFMLSVEDFFKRSIDVAFSLPLHSFWETKQFKGLKEIQVKVHNLAMRFVNDKMAEVDENIKEILQGSEKVPEKVDFLTYMLYSKPGQASGVDPTVNVVDLLTAGVDTTSYTLSWALYQLGRNPDQQDKLRAEVEEVVGREDTVTPTHISQMPYLRGCTKETLRMYPLAGLNQRQLQEDVVLSGYKVPAGTIITMPSNVMSMDENYFPEAQLFKPERWNRETTDIQSKFASLPFGFGPRMCVGRRVAELELHITLAQLVRSFRVEHRDSQPMEYIQRFLMIPEGDLNLAFTDLQ